MSQKLILNINCGSFIRVDGIKTPEYNRKLNELLIPFGENTLSHWSKTDKIIIVPDHLNCYVEKTYGEIYV
jgi:hypothetical protein